MKPVFFFLLFCFFTAKLFSQPFQFSQLTINEGISSGNVTCILQDSRGFMWFGTDNGLNKFDGYQMTIFRYDRQLSNTIGGNSIRCLFEDSQKNLWIGLKGDGLCRMNLLTGEMKIYKHTTEPSSISYNDVAGIVEDRKGEIWIAADRGGLDLYKPQTDNFEHFIVIDKQTEKPLNNAFTDIKLDINGNIWLSSWGGGIYRFDVEKRSFSLDPHWIQASDDDKICKHIRSLFVDNSGGLWIASGHGGLYSLKNDSLISYIDSADEKQIPSHSISSVNEDSEGKIWVCTINRGIYIMEKSGVRFLDSEKKTGNNLLADNNNCVYTDRTGIVWIGTPIGVNYYSPLLYQFSVNTTGEQQVTLADNQVLSLLKDRESNLWIGGINSISKISANGKAEQIKLPNGNNLVIFNALHEDEAGNMWIGCYSNLLIKYNTQTKKITSVKIPSPAGTDFSYRNIYDIYEDWDKSLWLATELGVINYNPAENSFKPLFESGTIIYPEDKSHVVFRDQNLELWVGTENGLKRFDRYNKYKCTYITTTDSQSITNNFITAVYEDKTGTMWIGTMGGLHRFDKEREKFQLVKRPDKMFGDPIFGICPDKQGNLWYSTTSEIIRLTPGDTTFQTYSASDGLQNKDFQLGAYFTTADGELLFGGKGGFNSFYPEKLIKNRRLPQAVITDFLIFNRSVNSEKNNILKNDISETKKIDIQQKQSVITFKFSALNYISPEKNKYAYKLEGFDKDWTFVTAEQRSATYTNLASGEYIFKVKAANNDDVWNNEPAEIKLIIHPPFWRTWFAYLIYALFTIGVAAIIFRHFMLREIDKKNLRIAQIEAERIKEIDEMKMNLFTNVSHEFRTPLSLILGPLTQIMEKHRYNDEDEELYELIYRNAQRLLRLINQLLDFRKIEAGKLELNLCYDNVGKFIHDVAVTFSFLATEKKINYEINISPEDIWIDFDTDKLDKVLYNLISNAFHYTAEGGKIAVTVNQNIKESMLQIEVSDTGTGMSPAEVAQLFTPFYQGKRQKQMRNGGSGIGLVLTKGIVDLFGGKIEVESEIDKGSVFRLEIPIITHEHFNDKEEEKPETVETVKTVETLKENETLDLILVVEDNNDMRLYIKNILGDKFKIEFANDGEGGLQIALSDIPDLIISDIMMPVMNGIEMVKELKKDDKTSLIPIILLTALHEESQVIEGYELGVDDYITKPFSAAILKARVQNILFLRKKSWEQYHQSKNLNDYADKLSENPRKQEFVNQINKIITSHLSDIQFGVEELASELKMSVNQLFRKVKTLMNTTPYNVIVQVRMTHAAHLLHESNYNISEIAFRCGYQELSNFSRSFKKYYNVSPRELISKERK